MEHSYAYAASALSTAWFLVHFFLGGREIAGPLRRSEALDPLVIAVSWMCWHMVSVTILLMGVLPLAGALLSMPGLIWSAILLSLGFFAVGVLAAPVTGMPYSRMPQGWLFLPVAVLGLLAVL